MPAAASGRTRRHAQQFTLSHKFRAPATCTHTVLRLEDVHGPHYVLPADGALAHPLSTFGAGYHVTTFKQHTVDDGVHADATQVFISRQLSSDTICGWKDEKLFFSCNGSLAGSLKSLGFCAVVNLDLLHPAGF